MDTVIECFGARSLDRRNSIGEHGGEDVDHLTIAIFAAGAKWPVFSAMADIEAGA